MNDQDRRTMIRYVAGLLTEQESAVFVRRVASGSDPELTAEVRRREAHAARVLNQTCERIRGEAQPIQPTVQSGSPHTAST
jgi:hypothetical protein